MKEEYKKPIELELKYKMDGTFSSVTYYLYVEVYGNEGCTFKIMEEDSNSQFADMLVYATHDIEDVMNKWNSL